MKTEVWAERVPIYRGRGIEIRVLKIDTEARQAHAVDLARLVPIEDGEMVPVALRLSEDEAQQFCDSLWAAGVRPTNGEGSVGQLSAVQEHLEDMRKLAFHSLKVMRDEVCIVGWGDGRKGRGL